MNPFVLETSFSQALAPAPARQVDGPGSTTLLENKVQISGGVGVWGGGQGPGIAKFFKQL